MPEDVSAPESEPLPATAEEAYGKLLWNVYLSGMLPSDDDLQPQDLYLGFPDDREENTFAICDVDGDGADELVLLWDYALAYCGELGLVYGYDSGAVHRELLEFPDLMFYENGIVTAGISHKQGRSGRFWPLYLYRYEADLVFIRRSARLRAGTRPFRRVRRASPQTLTPIGTAWYTSTPIFQKTRTAPIRR